MDWYPIGVSVVVPIHVTDPVTGLPKDVSPAPTVTLYHPDAATFETLSTTHTGEGEYEATVPTATLVTRGQWRVLPTVVGANVGADFDVFNVYDPVSYPRLVSFADAKTAVKGQGDADDPMLDRIVGWASARILIEYHAVRGVKTQRVNVRGGDPFFTLSHTPVRAVTSVVSAINGQVMTGQFIVTHPNAGMVTFSRGVGLRGPYDVTYEVGPDEIPAGVDGAALALIRHYWNQLVTRQTIGAYGSPNPSAVFRGLPNEVRNLLDVAPSPWGVA